MVTKLLLIAGLALSQGSWKTYRFDEGSFEVDFPSAPGVSEERIRIGSQNGLIKFWSCKSKEVAYIVGCAIIEQPTNAKQALKNIFKEAFLDQQERILTSRGNTSILKSFLALNISQEIISYSIQLHRGRMTLDAEVTFTVIEKDTNLRVRVFFARNRVYVLMTLAGPRDYVKKDADRFLNSILILPSRLPVIPFLLGATTAPLDASLSMR